MHGLIAVEVDKAVSVPDSKFRVLFTQSDRHIHERDSFLVDEDAEGTRNPTYDRASQGVPCLREGWNQAQGVPTSCEPSQLVLIRFVPSHRFSFTFVLEDEVRK